MCREVLGKYQTATPHLLVKIYNVVVCIFVECHIKISGTDQNRLQVPVDIMYIMYKGKTYLTSVYREKNIPMIALQI